MVAAAASSTRRVASVSSGPVPSPGIRVTLWVVMHSPALVRTRSAPRRRLVQRPVQPARAGKGVTAASTPSRDREAEQDDDVDPPLADDEQPGVARARAPGAGTRRTPAPAQTTHMPVLRVMQRRDQDADAATPATTSSERIETATAAPAAVRRRWRCRGVGVGAAAELTGWCRAAAAVAPDRTAHHGELGLRGPDQDVVGGEAGDRRERDLGAGEPAGHVGEEADQLPRQRAGEGDRAASRRRPASASAAHAVVVEQRLWAQTTVTSWSLETTAMKRPAGSGGGSSRPGSRTTARCSGSRRGLKSFIGREV